MNKKILAILIAQVFLAPGMAAAAEGDFFEIGGRSSDETSLNAAKLYEYRDLDANGIFRGQFTGRSDDYSVRLRGDNVGAEDQFLEMVGEKYNFLDYRIFNNKIIHNLSFGPTGGRAPWAGIGGGNLVLAVPTPGNNPALWAPFEHSLQRDNWGGHVEVSPDSPFYIRFSANELNTDGIRPQGFRSNGGGFSATELPGPVDWTTRNWSVETGWEATDYVVSANFTQSRYYNNLFNKQINWREATNNAANSATQQPDNVYNQFFLNGVYRKLPWNGALMGKFTYANLENEQNTDPLGSGLARSTPVFSGDVDYTDASLAYSAMPADNLDLRAYYYYHDRDNQSTVVAYGAFLTEALSYTKHNAGLELGYRLSRANKITGTYDYVYVTRSPITFYADETTDNKLQLEWRNTSLDNVTARFKYWYLWRSSDFIQNFTLPANNQEFIRNYIGSYDVADLDQNVAKFTVDWAVLDNAALGLELQYKKNDYDDTVIGRTDDERYGVHLFGNYVFGNGIKLTAFGDYENTKYDSFHRNMGGGSCPAALPNCFSPYGGTLINPASVTSSWFNWNGEVKGDNWGIGFGFDAPIGERLLLTGSFLMEQSDSEVNFTAPVVSYPINDWDDYTKYAFNLKGVYAVSKEFDVTAGWTYEDYKLRDLAFDGYSYVPASNRLTGAYLYPDYHVNVLYATLKYKFQ